MSSLRFRTAGAGDADGVADLHADSWRRHYRGAYSDAFLDGDVTTDRRSVWRGRLAAAGAYTTILAEDDRGLAGFVHVVFDDHERWGSLVDNLHVTSDRKRSGIGTALMARAAHAVAEQAKTRALYLWVLEQNTAAQQFYLALGGANVEKSVAAPPAGAARPGAAPNKFRIAWPDASVLVPARD
jgi:GNAT superfamily N-acetyltransferase